jgi:hypothetical protein
MEDPNSIYKQLQLEQEQRQKKQQQARVSAEVELLESASTMREYNARRDALKYLVIEPKLPLDEMTAADYVRSRAAQESATNQPKVEMGTPYRDYLRTREQSSK